MVDNERGPNHMAWTEIIGSVANVGTSAVSGGIFGIAGSLFGGVFKYFQTKQQQKFEQQKWAHELDLQKLELQRNREEDEHELAVIAQQGTWAGLDQSIKADATSTAAETYRWSKAIKELYRPFFTTAIFVFVYFIFEDLLAIVQGKDAALSVVFSPGEAKEVLFYIVNSVTFTASTAGVWWFGDRAFAPPGMKNR